jgi:pyridoxamine 5'-phosphate oxidase
VLATLFTRQHWPELRTVVLRHVHPEARQIVCHTDVRSPKVQQLRSDPESAWLFYDRELKTQLRLRGPVEIHHANERAQARWEQSAARSRQCYHAGTAPSSEIPSWVPAPPVENGFEHFAVVDCRVESIDWLYLRHEGHLRARFTWQSAGGWQGTWVAP